MNILRRTPRKFYTQRTCRFSYLIDSLSIALGTSIATYVFPEKYATMRPMSRRLSSIKRALAFLGFCFLLAVGQGCVQQPPLHRGNGPLLASEKQLPFHSERPATEAAHTVGVPADSQTPGGIPFHVAQDRVLPSGTLLTVQLEDSLFVRKVRAGNNFPASVAEPFTVAGHVVIDRGTRVVGQVESTQFETRKPGGIPAKGYFQLSLTGMTLGGRAVTLQTTSLFTRGIDPSSNASGGIRLPKGHRLTFRLTAPAVLGEGGSVANRGYLAPSSE
jgi:hypothetical protein